MHNENLLKLRELMNSRKLNAYIIPTEDYHQSEYVGEYFKERQFISGFTGSDGTLVITIKMLSYGLMVDILSRLKNSLMVVAFHL